MHPLVDALGVPVVAVENRTAFCRNATGDGCVYAEYGTGTVGTAFGHLEVKRFVGSTDRHRHAGDAGLVGRRTVR